MTTAPIGTLRRRLTLETPVRTGDDAAAAELTWSSLGELWASISPRSGREIVTADAVAARITHDIEIRWRGDVSAAMRLRDGSTIYAIHAVHDRDDKARRLICLVEEIAP